MQGADDPSFDDCTAGGPPADQDCGRLTWDIEAACGAGFTLGTNNTLTVSYQVVIPPAPGGLPRQLTNEGHAQAVLGGSIFSPFDTARVVQTDVTLGKAVDVTTPAAGDVITFTLQVANTSTSVDETDVFISDPIPADTTFVSGSITADGVFNGSGVFDAAQNAVVWDAPLFPWGASATLRFQVRVNPTVPAGTEIPNRGGYESVETPYFLSNEVEPVVQGPLLQAAKSIVGNPAVAHPSEIVTFRVRIENNGTSAASNVFLSDPFPGNAAYLAGSMSWSLNSGPFAALSDANDGVEASGGDGRAFADRLEFRVANLGASQDVTLRFRVLIDPGTVGQFLANQAVFSSDETPSTDTNLVQVPIVGNSQVTGHVFLDANNNTVQDPGEPDIPNVDVVVTDPTGAVQRVSTDANGDYTASVLLLTSPLGCYLDNVGAVAYNGSDGSLGWAATPWTEYGSGADGNPNTDPMRVTGDPQGAPGNNTLLIQGVGGNGATRGFTRAADLDPGSSATLTFRYFRLDFEADDQITLELNYGSGFGAVPGGVFGQPSPGVENDSVWQNASFSLDTAQLPANPVTLRLRSTGGFAFANDQFFFDDVEICAASVSDADVTLNVDETDPDFPPGAVLTTANDPQTVAAVQGGTVASDDVGYRQPDLIFTKTSNAINNEVSPGQTVTYTMTITNNIGLTQTAITLSDPLPTGTSYVAGSSRVSLPPQQVSVRVSQSSDDAEENLGSGVMSLGNNDLDIVYSGGTEQMVGVRFQGVAVPPGATVTAATIQFQADETDNLTTNVLIAGQAADSPGTFTAAAGNISSRPQTAASVAWTNIEPWATNGDYLTPDISSIVQEIVDRPGWVSGNNMVDHVLRRHRVHLERLPARCRAVRQRTGQRPAAERRPPDHGFGRFTAEPARPAARATPSRPAEP